jgi:protein involved in polysaccharide export with SLBB domain
MSSEKEPPRLVGRAREQHELDVILDSAAAGQGQGSQALTVGQSLLDQLKSSKAVGRLVIDVMAVMNSPVDSEHDVVMRDGDRLVIPKRKQEVTVIGEVQNSTSHYYREHLVRDDYIGLSGGMTRKADKGRIYIVRANGSVVSSESGGWFRRIGQVAMRPGDTIVVPLDTDSMPA